MIIQAAIFDWDGFLFDSEESCRYAHNKVLRACNLRGVTAQEYRNRQNNSMKWYRHAGVNLSENNVRRLFFAHFDTSRCGLVSGAEEVICCLHERGIPLAIVSAHSADEIEERLSQFQIKERFQSIIGNARSGKQEAILETCAKLAVTPDRALFGDDMPEGVAEGKGVGTKTVLYAPHDYSVAHVADYHITDLRQILEIV